MDLYDFVGFIALMLEFIIGMVKLLEQKRNIRQEYGNDQITRLYMKVLNYL